MEQLAADLLPLVEAGVIAAFVLVAVAAAVRAHRGSRAGRWATAAFGSLGLALFVRALADGVATDLPVWLDEFTLICILAFPYLLLRFTAAFRDFPRWLEAAAGAAAVGVLAATVALRAATEASVQPGWAGWYVGGVLAYWMLVSLVTIVSLWRQGRRQPTVARRRMRLMSVATLLLAVALLLAAEANGVSVTVQLAVQTVALGSGALFGLGLSPPRALRLSWRQPEEHRLQTATTAVLRAVTPDDVARELLPPTVRLLGGSGAAMVDVDGRVAASEGNAPAVGDDLDTDRPGCPEGAAREAVPLGEHHGQLVVWTSPYTPFFGREEIDLLRTMGTIAALALDRCALLAEERAQREVIEQAQLEAEFARQQAMEANAAKTDFLSRMSHELRTPLNAILGFGQLLEMSSLEAEDAEGVRHILKAGRHLLALINDVLDLSRIEAGTLTISLETVDAGELVHDAIALIQPLATSRSIQISIHPAGCDKYVMTDRQRCRQVLLNLLSNAVKYNRDGGRVDVSCVAVGESALRVSVRDTGPGIHASRQPQLFEPFERLGAETTAVEGTGLGLALTKHLIERLGGAIGVESAPGQGSTFWIDLPVTEAPAGAVESPSLPQARAHTGERKLLLVEDNLANLRLVEAMLRRRPDITVLPAMQGQMAIELAHEHQPDVVVLDLHLPDLPGREVLHRLRADPGTRDIPVVIASADATPGRVRQLREEGAFAYVTKPIDLHEFLDVVDAALAQRRGERDS